MLGAERRTKMKTDTGNKNSSRGSVYCFVCTHTVEADVVAVGRKIAVRSGQKCPRCLSSLNAAYVLGESQAA